MLNKKREFDRKTKNFFVLSKEFVVFTLILLCFPNFNNAQVEVGTVESSIKGNIYVEEGTVIYNSDKIINAKIIFITQKNEKKFKTNNKKILATESTVSLKKNPDEKSKKYPANRIVKSTVFFKNSSKHQLSKLATIDSFLIMPIPNNGSLKAIIQKYNSSFQPLIYNYKHSYFRSNPFFYKNSVLSSQSIRPPPVML